ncbi:hypothetical protein WCN91_08120 [Pseudoalteromonas sp. YIC-827]|uniref:Spore coat protein U (SCPU) domain-containing protein n=1 Tax=Pseudoalteromonas qingdaonensis TaxID=3131913 RepID=A0ABU9MVU4_9GAMM
MKISNVKTLVAVGAAALMSGSVMAQNVDIGGAVPSVCAINGLGPVLFPALAMGSTSNQNFNVQCNDVDGATITMTTAEGHLQNADHEDQGVGYHATLTADGNSFTLQADNGINDQSASGSFPASPVLAAGTGGDLEIEVVQAPTWAGTYADTLQIAITAN